MSIRKLRESFPPARGVGLYPTPHPTPRSRLQGRKESPQSFRPCPFFGGFGGFMFPAADGRQPNPHTLQGGGRKGCRAYAEPAGTPLHGCTGSLLSRLELVDTPGP